MFGVEKSPVASAMGLFVFVWVEFLSFCAKKGFMAKKFGCKSGVITLKTGFRINLRGKAGELACLTRMKLLK